MSSGDRLNFHGFALTDLVILLGIIVAIVYAIADFRGWSRSSKTLRRENEDLIRRNKELEEAIRRHEQRIEELSAQVAELKLRDVTALYELMTNHERNAAGRAEDTQRVLIEIRDTLKGRT